MTTTGKLLSVAQVTALLSSKLGASRQWVDTLNDHRQDRGDLKGVLLLPFGRKKGDSGKSSTPMYDPVRLMQFIKAVQLAYGCEKPFAGGVQSFTYEDIPGMSEHHWRSRIVTPVTSSAVR